MKKFIFSIALAFIFAPMSASAYVVVQNSPHECFERADEIFKNTPGSHEQKFEEFAREFDACMAE